MEIIELQFFNFTIDLCNWEVCKVFIDGKEIIDKEIWESLYAIYQKYMKLKERKKMFDKKQKKYCEDMEAWKQHKEHLCEHIQKAESKLTEYKNTILVFWKLASCNWLSK